MSDQVKVWIVMQVMNVLKLMLFVKLAMYFNKWWIALFVLLFWTSFDDKKTKSGGNIEEETK